MDCEPWSADLMWNRSNSSSLIAMRSSICRANEMEMSYFCYIISMHSV